MKYVKQHPFLTYAIVVLLIEIIITFIKPQYDDGRISALLMITTPVWGVIYWDPNEILYSFNNGVGFNYQNVLSVIVGLSFCVLLDYYLMQFKKRRYLKQNET